jgi:hypothetical protein
MPESPPRGERANEHAQAKGNADSLVGMVAHNLVRRPRALDRALLSALDDDLQVINETFGWSAPGFVYRTA